MCSSLQMEKEIKELKLQRDLAQSRLQDLLQVVGDNHGSKHPMVHETYCFLLYSLVLVVAHNKRFFFPLHKYRLLEETLLSMFLSHVRMSNRQHQQLSAAPKILGFKDDR